VIFLWFGQEAKKRFYEVIAHVNQLLLPGHSAGSPDISADARVHGFYRTPCELGRETGCFLVEEYVDYDQHDNRHTHNPTQKIFPHDRSSLQVKIVWRKSLIWTDLRLPGVAA